MPRLGFAIDNRSCIGCHACTVACKAEHSVPLGVNRTWVKYVEKGTFPSTRRSFNVQRCNHCQDAPCVEICPVTSLFQRPDGIVDFDPTRCIGCKSCMQACPYDAIYLDPATNTAAKCNYCTHRVDNGYEPACVVVCPVEAIVSGDLDDPAARIAQLDRTQRVQYPKIEKGTNPKLFYVGGETAALDPASAPPAANYLWSGNAASVRPGALEAAAAEAEGEARARRVYDAKSKPPPWGWMVSAYITTKAVAAGSVLFAWIAYAAGASASVLPGWALLVSLLFLAATGGLLVADLKQPARFAWVLLRPQWRSWLVRGAYLILGFSILAPLTWIVAAAGASRRVQLALGGVSGLLAGAVAVYTAFLLAQAKGRDYWQSPLLAVSMFVDAVAAGACVFAWAGAAAEAAVLGLGIGVAALSGLLVAEFVTRHPNRNAELAARLILRGPFAGQFWGGVVGVGLVAPAVLLFFGLGDGIAAGCLLAGIAVKNNVLIQAPQRIPLS